ncbi:MAG: hypothetical protein JXR37_33865 [Kiritimatiellae bacterium]|nr:hypothetical protein [Kiritimatiellia bacterium]
MSVSMISSASTPWRLRRHPRLARTLALQFGERRRSVVAARETLALQTALMEGERLASRAA